MKCSTQRGSSDLVLTSGLLLLLVLVTGCPGLKLQDAVKRGDLRRVERMLDDGVDPDVRHPFTLDTPLIEAARHGRLEIARVLIRRGADVNLQGEAWYGPLHCSAALGDLEMMALLLESGADPARFRGHDTPLHSAVSAEQTPAVRLLLDHGADPGAKGVDEATPLELAAGRGNAELVELLLGLGVDVNAQGSYGRTALHAAAWGDQVEAGRLLLEHGADPALECNGRAVAGRSEAFRALLERQTMKASRSVSD